MTRPMPGGRRRIDRVLDPAFSSDLQSLPVSDLRIRRREAEQEEADLSYVRRLLQGRIDIVRAELARRAPDGADSSLLDTLSEILTDGEHPARRLGRHLSVEPSRVDDHRRKEEQLAGDASISDVGARSADELRSSLEALRQQEAEVSDTRRQVQAVVDQLSADLTRRYRDGGASVDELLRPGSAAAVEGSG